MVVKLDIMRRLKKMSRKHFEGIAMRLRKHKASWELCDAICDYFERENERFDRDRFMNACGFE